MGVLLMVRHGQATLGTGNYDTLSELGRLQAAVVGARLRDSDLDIGRVVCGSLTRQRDTALAILSAVGMPADRLEVDPRLDEYDHEGVFAAHSSGVTFETAGGRVTPRELQASLDRAIVSWIAGDGEYAEPHDAFVSRILRGDRRTDRGSRGDGRCPRPAVSSPSPARRSSGCAPEHWPATRPGGGERQRHQADQRSTRHPSAHVQRPRAFRARPGGADLPLTQAASASPA